MRLATIDKMIRVLFILLLLGVHCAFAGFKFSNRDARIRLVSEPAQFIVRTPVTGYTGTLEIADNNVNRIQGSTITFNRGSLESSSLEAYFSGVYDPTSTDIIKLKGGHILRCSSGTLLPDISICGTNNIIEGAPIFTSDIVFTNSHSSLRLALQSELNQNIILNGSKLILDNYLTLEDNVYIKDWGTIDFNGNRVSLPAIDSVWTGTLNFLNAHKLEINAHTQLDGMWVFGPENGVSVVAGNGHVLDLSHGGTLWVRANHTVEITDLAIIGLGGNNKGWILFEDQNSTLSLSNCTLTLAHNYNFTQGVMYFYGAESTIITSDRIFSAVDSGVVYVDGTRLVFDALGSTGQQTFLPAAFDGINLISVNDGIVATHGVSSLVGLVDFVCDNSITVAASGDSISPARRLIFRGDNSDDLILNGDGFKFDFAQSPMSLILVNSGKRAVIKNIILNNFSPSSVFIGAGGSLVFAENVTINLGKSEDINMTLSFVSGNNYIRGYGASLVLNKPVSIAIFADTSLTLDSVIVTSLSGCAVHDMQLSWTTTQAYIASTNKLRCLDASSKLILRNSELTLANNYSFTVGSIEVKDHVSMHGLSKKMIYSSPNELRIKPFSTLELDRDITFSYESQAPTLVASKQQLVLEDSSSRLVLNGSTLHTTWTGLKLQIGTLTVQDHSAFVSEARNNAEAVVFKKDLMVEILSGAIFDFTGLLIYE